MPSISREARRLSKAKRLRARLRALCLAAGGEPPLLAYDRWVARSQLMRPAEADPLLPSATSSDAGLIKDLRRVAALAPSAPAIALQLATESSVAASAIGQSAESPSAASAVRLEWRHHGTIARLSADSMRHYCELTRDHYRKLAARHQSTTGTDDASLLRRRLFCMCLRYEALGCHGHQAAISPEVFDVLRSHLGVETECFASPLNAQLRSYCSAFYDVDAPFGSHGSFFALESLEGSFEANPPFEPELMRAAVDHASALIQRADDAGTALSFAFVVPTWESLPFHRLLMESRWRRGTALRLEADMHGFLDGAQHEKRAESRLRVSSFGTTVCVLQSARGAKKWPVKEALLCELESAFKNALPSAESVEARLREASVGDAVKKLLKRRAAGADPAGTKRSRSVP